MILLLFHYTNIIKYFPVFFSNLFLISYLMSNYFKVNMLNAVIGKCGGCVVILIVSSISFHSSKYFIQNLTLGKSYYYF